MEKHLSHLDFQDFIWYNQPMATRTFILGHSGDNRYKFIISDEHTLTPVYIERYFNEKPLRINFSYQNANGEWASCRVFDYHTIESARIYWKYLKSVGFKEILEA